MDKRCANCGEPTFFNHSMWSSDTRATTHGSNREACERAAAVIATLPALYDHAIQALVEIQELTGRFIRETDVEEWRDIDALQGIIFTVNERTSDGITGPK
jgi:hypothetical protein